MTLPDERVSVLRRSPAFRRVFLADALAQLSHGMLMVAFPMFILQVTGDVSLTGLAFSGEVAAFGLLSPLAGWWADRVNQKWLMVAANTSRIALLLLLLHVLADAGSLAACLALSLGLGASAALFAPARAAFLRRLLQGNDLMSAVALEGTSSFLNRLLAPAFIGGVLFFFPPTAGIWLSLVLYALSSALLWPAWVGGPRAEASESDEGSWRSGWRHLWGSPLRILLGLDVVLQMVGWASWASTVAFLQVVLHQPAACCGALMSATGLAGALGTRVASRLRAGRGTLASLLALLAASYFFVPQAGDLVTLVGIWMVRGLAMGVCMVLFSQQMAALTPPDKMGRVQAAWEMSVRLAAFLGTVSTPLLLRSCGAGGSFYVYGAVVLAAVALLKRR